VLDLYDECMQPLGVFKDDWPLRPAERAFATQEHHHIAMSRL
jgi:hypothetical protein